MLRYYISKYVDFDPTGTGERVRKFPAAAIYGGRWASVAVGDATAPGAWAFVALESADHTGPANDPNTIALPDLAFDASFNTIPQATRTAFLDQLRDFGPANLAALRSEFRAGDGWRTVLRRIGALLLAGFDENGFAVAVS